MKNLMIVMLLILSSCKSAPVVTPPIISPTPSPIVAEVHGYVDFEPRDYYTTPAQRVKIYSAGKKMNEVVQSQCFYDFMSKRKLIQTNGKSPEEVAKHLQSLRGLIPVEMYSPGVFSSAVAYRSPPSLAIHLSYNYFTVDMDDCDWAATMGHESLGHSLGEYDHDYKWNLARSYSVPYSIGGADQSQGGDAFDLCCVRSKKKL
jgi:hypothetical protein